MSTPVPWGEFTQDPRRPDAAGLRAGDRDRDVALRVLADGYADGKLTKEEYDERADLTSATKTLGELTPLIADLVPHTPQASTGRTLASPDELHRKAVRRWESQRREALTGFLIATIVCWTIWVLTGFSGPGGFDPSFPWPVFVTLGTGIHLLQVQLRRSDITEQEQRRLERKQRKALEGRPRRPDTG
jgi:hypothetical protein